MKIKLADGTEVDVADDNPLAVASQELERVKALGFTSIEEYQNHRESELAKLKKQTEADNEFIQRQKGEIGDLRKQVGKPPKEEDEEEGKPTVKTEETAEEREARYAKLNDGMQENLTEEQRAHADEEFKKAYQEATPQERANLNTEEGRNAFMGLVFPEQQTEKTPVSLFRKPEAKPLSISEQVQSALKNTDEGRSRRPVIPQTTKSGFKPRGNEQQRVVIPPPRNGGVIDSVKQIEAQTQG